MNFYFNLLPLALLLQLLLTPVHLSLISVDDINTEKTTTAKVGKDLEMI